MKTKRCKTCPPDKAKKPVSEFTKSTSYKDGYCRDCKKCRVNASQRRYHERKNCALVKVGSKFQIVQTKRLSRLTGKYDITFSNKDILDLESQYNYPPIEGMA